MIIRNVDLEIVCGITSKIPDNELPEIAFAGKSNVGKSSLINTMMNRKALARTSAKPGKTQTINFYNINNAMYLVDLPGYGFTKAPESERVKWGQMTENYLHHSKQLKAVFLLVDIRHKPSENDKVMYDWIVYQGYRPIIIATKLDKLKRSQIEACILQVREELGLKENDILIPFSSVTAQGREEVWQLMDHLIGWVEPEKSSDGSQKKQIANQQKKPVKNTNKKLKKQQGRQSEKVRKKQAEKKSEKIQKKRAEKKSEKIQKKQAEKKLEKVQKKQPGRKSGSNQQNPFQKTNRGKSQKK